VRTEAEISLHEAGHATVAAALGRRVLRMALAADGGVCEVEPPAHRDDARARREWLLIVAGGEAAEKLCERPTPGPARWRL
jgi:hypothetical protein